MATRVVLAAVLVLAALAGRAPAQGGGGLFTREPDPARGLKLIGKPSLTWRGTLPQTEPRLRDELLKAAWSSEPGKKAMRELGLSETEAREALVISTQPGSAEFKVVLTLPHDTREAREAGARFLDGLAERVAPGVVASWVEEANRVPLEQAEKSVARARAENEEARAAVAQRRQEIRRVANVVDPSPAGVREAAARLDQEKQKILLDMAGQTARQRALEERVAKLGDAAAARVGQDPIAAELEKIVKVREAELELQGKLRQEGRAADSEKLGAEVRVAEAKSKLLERRETMARAAGAEMLGELNKELVTLTIMIAEGEARLQYVEKRLDGLARAADLVDEFEQVLGSAARAARRLEQAESRIEELSRQMAVAPPFSATLHWGGTEVEQVAPGTEGKK